MQTRKQTIGKKILRVFEIALFFAISALGYGLMLKVSSFNTKSKSRDRDAIALQRSLEMNSIKALSGKRLFTNETAAALSQGNPTSGHAFAAIHPLPRLAQHLLSGKAHAAPVLTGSNRLARPCNLLEQNPVLLN
ncbi:MAG: hypothetical protein JW764_01600 [Chlorobiaceae bacterium]|nr:hypothetical protein [Chlorobiaceae bacterium]